MGAAVPALLRTSVFLTLCPLASVGHLVLSVALGHLTSVRGSEEGLLSGRLAFLRQLTDVPSL